MYTPQEIRSIEFTKSLGGYKTSEVDEFIDRCADTVEALLNEKNELSKKLQVLADKLVEYRNDEDSIRTALLSAQRLGDTVVREANHKAGLILDDANIKAQKIEETAKRKIVDEERELERVKKEVSLFKNRMMSIYREHLSLIGMLPVDEAASETEGNETPAAEPEAAPSAAEEPSRPAAESTVPAAAPAASEAPAPIAVPKAPDTVAYEQTVAAFRMNIPILDEEGTEPAAEPAAAVPKPSSRFSDLKFGENYDISQDTDEEPGFFKKKRSER